MDYVAVRHGVALAVAGDTADVGDSPLYDAADGSTLSGALSDITGGLDVCTAAVVVPESYDTIAVSVAGAPIAKDPNHTDGWDLSDDGSLSHYGAACATAASGATVDVTFGCAQ